MKSKGKVFVGVSGGVDSSVALALLKKEGYDVTGVFLKGWYPDWQPCNWKEERRSAMRVCATLGLPFLTLDCEKEYKKEVVDYMIREYSLGRVPNPDIFCNKYIKFGVFLKKALEMGADFVATGHYAQVKEENGQFKLLESVDKEKDQSYFLYTLTQKELRHTLFPVGGMVKEDVRKIAKALKLPTAEKKDSQGICFLGQVDMKDFLTHYIETKKGDVLGLNGEIIGEHNGALLYAIGERHGFTITKKGSTDPRYFVVSKNISENTITVANKEDGKDEIYSVKEINLKDIDFISAKPGFPLKTSVRIRYRQEKQDCILSKTDSEYSIVFDESQNAISPGQSAVLYHGEECIGGGIIEAVR